MAVKQELNTLLNKKMDRKDFLKSVAIGVVAISGVSAVLRAVAPAPVKRSVSVSNGYGSSPYGGKKTS